MLHEVLQAAVHQVPWALLLRRDYCAVFWGPHGLLLPVQNPVVRAGRQVVVAAAEEDNPAAQRP